MKRRWVAGALGVCLSLSACATVHEPTVKVISEKPEISRTLTAENPKRFLKRKVAIARFSNETKYGQSFLLDASNDRIGKQASDILAARLAATDKFLLLERSDIDKIMAELNRGDLGGLNLSADYLIAGSVSEFGRKEIGRVGIFSRTRKQVATAKVNIRLIDVRTGQVIYSEEGAGEAFSEAGNVLGVGARAGYDSSLNDQAISAAISKLVNNVVENLLEKPWRSYLLARESGFWIMAGGKSQGLRVGDVFGVYRRGKKVKNPQTGMQIELPGDLIGQIEIVKFFGTGENDEISFCALKSGEVPEDNLADLYIQELPQTGLM